MKKYKIGYTTGTFDLFHIGHLNILKKSKEMCDFLIVGVSTDEVVQNYKHKVPVIPFRERMEIVKSIRYVDQVVPQLSMDDWKGSDLYNDYEVKFKEIGVDIVYISHTKGISSSKIADEIKYGK